MVRRGEVVGDFEIVHGGKRRHEHLVHIALKGKTS